LLVNSSQSPTALQTLRTIKKLQNFRPKKT
jgi:hypothetical protein